jgi:predicted metalloprotease
MRLTTLERRKVVAISAAAATALAATWAALAESVTSKADEGAGALMQAPAFLAEESGTPPRAMRLRAIVSRAWDDSIAAWKRVLEGRDAEVEGINLRYVSRLAPHNCYGLYAGEGPAYCSGNRTVFIGTDAAKRLMARFGPHGEAGIAFLIGHEIGHHIQNMNGRFLLLGRAISRAPALRAELVRRFELEADCYAGVWMHASEAWARSDAFKAAILSVLGTIGDDTIAGEQPQPARAAAGVHGTSEQRTRWFLRGVKAGDLQACNTFRAARL